ncbi:hypothetical protein DU002_03655 [Corallincola holothuriorum]|uniref:Peptidase M61 catalytic domain-containing protein n=1 Tax=Corallincola holothuriorum TaxID=2282215 RepID=A0A368NM01_9GAMM|nr:hypothetical protein [Corallincola holothuriorum]RCU51577.1 hypothetical protein DU002_03655 [Corallincola holothuriorum]
MNDTGRASVIGSRIGRLLAVAIVGLSFSLFAAANSQPITVPGGTLSLALDPALSPSQQEKVRRWLQETALVVSKISGQFPIPIAHIEVKVASYGQGPVPWGQITRGTPNGITFYVNPEQSLRQFQQDWTGVHEFSHLLIPFPGSADIWLSEGLASYYQNILRGTQGILTEEQVWQEMHAGFLRGQKDAIQKDRPLRELSGSMWSTGSYKRVYWSGAAYFLLADVRLQKLGSPHSMASVMAGFQACCRMLPQEWNGPEMILRFDQLSESDVFSTLYGEIIDQAVFPDLTEAYTWLGLDLMGGRLEPDSATKFKQRRLKLIYPHRNQ